MENNSFGALVVHELKQGGASIPVNEENKREYVKLYVNYRFMRGIEQQFLWLQKGVHSIGIQIFQYHQIGMGFEFSKHFFVIFPKDFVI